MAVVPSVLNAGDFKRQYNWDVEFVHSGVDSGWHYWIISVSLTHTAAFCNLNTTIPAVAITMQAVRYSDVDMGQQSEGRTSVQWWMNVQWCRVELCIGALTFTCEICCMTDARHASVYSSMALRTCKPITKLSLSPITKSYSSNKLLND